MAAQMGEEDEGPQSGKWKSSPKQTLALLQQAQKQQQQQ
jgi:hypothetical protein